MSMSITTIAKKPKFNVQNSVLTSFIEILDLQAGTSINKNFYFHEKYNNDNGSHLIIQHHTNTEVM